MTTNIDYIRQIHLNDIPWERLSTPYETAVDFPEWFRQMTDENPALAADAAHDIALNIEHQSTLWQVTPFAMIILDRLLSAAIEKYTHTKDDDDKLVIKHILEIYVPVFETVDFMNRAIGRLQALPHFSDMLKDDYLLPEPKFFENDEDPEEALEAYLEGFYTEMPEELFYSFFYYAWLALALSLNKNVYKLIEFNDVEINRLLDKLNDKANRAFIDNLMYE